MNFLFTISWEHLHNLVMLLFSIFPLSSLSCVLTRLLVECRSEDESTNKEFRFRENFTKSLERLDWGCIGYFQPFNNKAWHDPRTDLNGMLWKYDFIVNRLIVTNNFSVPTVSWLGGGFLMEISLSARVDTCHTRRRPMLWKNRHESRLQSAEAFVSSAITQDCASVEGLCCPYQLHLIESLGVSDANSGNTLHCSLSSISQSRLSDQPSNGPQICPSLHGENIFSATLISLAFKNCCPITVTPLAAPKVPRNMHTKKCFHQQDDPFKCFFHSSGDYLSSFRINQNKIKIKLVRLPIQHAGTKKG